MSTKTQKLKTIAQQAAIIRRALKRKGINTLTDYKGNQVPLEYIPNSQLVEHSFTSEVNQVANQLLTALEEFKYMVQSNGDQIYSQHLSEGGIEAGEIKNFTLNSLDRKSSIKFTRPPRYSQDEKELAISREYKKKWLADEAENVPDYVLELVIGLIESKDGNIDQAQISELNKMKEKIRNKNFRKMVDHFNKSLQPYYAKRYEQFIYRDEQGQEHTIILTYAKVSPKEP